MTRPAILDLDLVVVPREATQVMPFSDKTMRDTYTAMLSASPYLTAWDDVRKYVEGLETRLVAVAGPCSLGVGCEQYGVCYADAHGKAEECGKPSFACEALKDARRIADHDKELWLSAEEKIEILRSENSRLQSELEDTAGLEKAAEEEVSVVEARATAAETEAATLRALLAEAEKALERIVCVTPDECFIGNTAWELVECKPSGGGWIGAEDLRAARAYMEGK